MDSNPHPPGGQATVTVEADYIGPLTNVFQVMTEEGVSRVYTQTSTVGRLIYWPIILCLQ